MFGSFRLIVEFKRLDIMAQQFMYIFCAAFIQWENINGCAWCDATTNRLNGQVHFRLNALINCATSHTRTHPRSGVAKNKRTPTGHVLESITFEISACGKSTKFIAQRFTDFATEDYIRT